MGLLIIKADQQDAMISIDDVFAGYGQVKKQFNVGEKHSWKIECSMYHTEIGEVTIESNKITIYKKLRPAFGYLHATSQPESGATVFIDNGRVGETPYKSEKISSGQHSVKVMKELYIAAEETITITDGATTQVVLELLPQFVNVDITTDKQSDIYVDTEKKGKGSWIGRLSAGIHVFEAKQDSYRTSSIIDTLVLGNDKKIVIPNPEPIFGTVDINSKPIEAIIYIDDKRIGETPSIVSDILIGKHELRLEKNGYITVNKTFTLEEDTILSINEKLKVSFQSSPTQTKDIKGGKQHNKIKRYNYFTLNFALDSYSKPSFGLTYGNVKKYGWYLNVMTNGRFKFPDRMCSAEDALSLEKEGYFWNGKKSVSHWSVILGGVISIKSVGIYAGAGYGSRNLIWYTQSGLSIGIESSCYQGIALDAGVIVILKDHWPISLGYSSIGLAKYNEIKIGIGYGF